MTATTAPASVAPTGAEAGTGRRQATAAQWESRIRRSLLVAHALPATFGLLAVTLLVPADDVRRIDVGIWVFVVAWDLFLLTAGWRRIAEGTNLARWVIADAVVMAMLAFIGTPVRTIVVYAAVEGALFAAVFVSARIALVQVAIVYSAVAAAGIARRLGSDLPSPNTGWLLPLTVTLVGVLALTFLGRALRDLVRVTDVREEAVRERGRILAEAEAESARLAAAERVEAATGEGIERLVALADEYRRRAAGSPEGEREAQWLQEAARLGRDSMRRLAELRADDAPQSVLEAVEDGLRRASALRTLGGTPARRLPPEAAEIVMPASVARACADFVSEAITNAVVHGAAPYLVSAEPIPGGVELSVSDAGAGFAPEGTGRGLGLESMRACAVEVGGSIAHTDPPTGGHRVTLTVPVGAA